MCRQPSFPLKRVPFGSWNMRRYWSSYALFPSAMPIQHFTNRVMWFLVLHRPFHLTQLPEIEMPIASNNSSGKQTKRKYTTKTTNALDGECFSFLCGDVFYSSRFSDPSQDPIYTTDILGVQIKLPTTITQQSIDEESWIFVDIISLHWYQSCRCTKRWPGRGNNFQCRRWCIILWLFEGLSCLSNIKHLPNKSLFYFNAILDCSAEKPKQSRPRASQKTFSTNNIN